MIIIPKLRIVKRPILTEISDLLRYVFRSETQIHIATHVIRLIQSQGNFVAKNWNEIVNHLNVSVGAYTRTMFTLRSIGLLEKRGGTYYLSGDFSLALRRMVEYWDAVRSKAQSMKMIRDNMVFETELTS